MFGAFGVLELESGLAYETGFPRAIQNAFIVGSLRVALTED
jgi:hypothetical protein